MASVTRRLASACAAALALSVGGATLAAPAGAGTSKVIDGPDVSSYQHPGDAKIDWTKVAAGHEFAIVKATEGTGYRNPYFWGDYMGARKAGLVRGSYHFARPAYPVLQTARAQAQAYVDMLGDSVRTANTLPPALDLETNDAGMPRGALVTWAQTFLLTVHRLTGRVPFIYTYPSFWTYTLGDPVALARYPLWMAAYSGPVDPTAVLWQYTSTATVDGITGRVDMSRLQADAERFTTLSDGTTRDPWPVTPPGAPQQVYAAPGSGAATVTWLPGDTGSKPVTSYTVTASPGGRSVTVDGATTVAVVPGLTDGTAYRFTVRATSEVGAGATSARTAAVTPMVPTALTVTAASTDVTVGDDVTVDLRLTRTDTGAGVGGQSLQVATQLPGSSTWSTRPAVVTRKYGHAYVRLHQPQQSQTLRVMLTGRTGWNDAVVTLPVAVRSGVTAALSQTRVRVNHSVTLSGDTTPAVAGLRVRRQGFYDGAWHTWAQTRTDAEGHYTFTITPTTRATNTYRVVVRRADGRYRGFSPTLQLRVH